MFDRWRSTDYIRETTKIVRMKLDVGQNNLKPDIIVPDRWPSSKTLPSSQGESKAVDEAGPGSAILGFPPQFDREASTEE